MTTSRITNLILALLFMLFAYFQLNDPDPIVWVLIYGYVAAIGFLAFAQKFYKWLIIDGLLIFGAGILYLLPSVYDWLANHSEVSLLYGMAADKPYIEESRECGGLSIALLGLVYFYVQGKKRW
jgi:hypothetical protein